FPQTGQQRQQRALADSADDIADEQDAQVLAIAHVLSGRILPLACVPGFGGGGAKGLCLTGTAAPRTPVPTPPTARGPAPRRLQPTAPLEVPPRPTSRSTSQIIRRA